MVLFKAWHYMRDRRLVRGAGLNTESGNSNIAGVLYRDSLLYFIG